MFHSHLLLVSSKPVYASTTECSEDCSEHASETTMNDTEDGHCAMQTETHEISPQTASHISIETETAPTASDISIETETAPTASHISIETETAPTPEPASSLQCKSFLLSTFPLNLCYFAASTLCLCTS